MMLTFSFLFLRGCAEDEILIVKYGLIDLLACFSSKEDSLRGAKAALEGDAGFPGWLSALLILHPSLALKEKAAMTLMDFFKPDAGRALAGDYADFFIFFLKSLLALLPTAEEHPFATSEYFRLQESLFVYDPCFTFSMRATLTPRFSFSSNG